MSNYCIIEGCKVKAKYKSLCGKHYKRQWRHGNANKTLINMERESFNCCVEGCKKIGRYPITMMCHPHHTMFKRYGRTDREKAKFGEGRPLTAAGYILITRNGERFYEHVWLAEQALGKKLPPGAVVHHMNEDKTDNFTPLNLVICPDQSYHKLLHQRIEFYKTTGRMPRTND